MHVERRVSVGKQGARPVYLSIGTITREPEEEDGYVVTIVDLSRLKQAESPVARRIALETPLASLASRFVAVGPEGVDVILVGDRGMISQKQIATSNLETAVDRSEEHASDWLRDSPVPPGSSPAG